MVVVSVCAKLRIEVRRNIAKQADRIMKRDASHRRHFVIEYPLMTVFRQKSEIFPKQFEYFKKSCRGRLWMIGGSAKECTQQPFAAGPAGLCLVGWFQSDKH